jgi:hypothetical protein
VYSQGNVRCIMWSNTVLFGLINSPTRGVLDYIIQCVGKVTVHLGVCIAVSRRRIVGPWTSLPTPFISAQQLSKCRLQKVFANKIKRFQACIDARGHHFHHLL